MFSSRLTSNITRWRRGAAFIGLSAILSCTYGPEEQHHRIDHTTIDPHLKTIGVLVTHYSVRQPTGVSGWRFPKDRVPNDHPVFRR